MLIAALFMLIKNWRQLKYLSTDEWLNKKYIHTINNIGQKKEVKY